MAGRNGSRGPKPWRQRTLSTTFLRVPRVDWPAVSRGYKTEFRAGGEVRARAWTLRTPTPVVAYSVGRDGKHAGPVLMVLEASWVEPVGAISEESLAREGFRSLGEFRRYWMERERKRFEPTRYTVVYRVRPWDDSTDARHFADLILGRLYGDFLSGYVPEEEAA